MIEQEISHSPNPSELKYALRKLKQHVDALWILNDDHLLSPRLIADGWIPGLNERPWSPAIVGAASLVSPQQSFGTFAVLPDHTALGAQAAGLVFDIADNSWMVPEDAVVQLPLSTTTTVDLGQVKERFSLREGALNQVDRVLEWKKKKGFESMVLVVLQKGRDERGARKKEGGGKKKKKKKMCQDLNVFCNIVLAFCALQPLPPRTVAPIHAHPDH